MEDDFIDLLLESNKLMDRSIRDSILSKFKITSSGKERESNFTLFNILKGHGKISKTKVDDMIAVFESLGKSELSDLWLNYARKHGLSYTSETDYDMLLATTYSLLIEDKLTNFQKYFKFKSTLKRSCRNYFDILKRTGRLSEDNIEELIVAFDVLNFPELHKLWLNYGIHKGLIRTMPDISTPIEKEDTKFDYYYDMSVFGGTIDPSSFYLRVNEIIPITCKSISILSGNKVCISFDANLTESQQKLLDNLVSSYKSSSTIKDEEMKEEENLCVVCMDSERNSVLLECGHICVCYNCAKMLHQCPMCRKTIARIVKTYVS